MANDVADILVLLVMFFVVFAVYVSVWYGKVNRVVSVLEGIQASLHNLNRSSGGTAVALPQLTPSKEICPFCKEPSLKSNSTCEVCGKMKR